MLTFGQFQEAVQICRCAYLSLSLLFMKFVNLSQKQLIALLRKSGLFLNTVELYAHILSTLSQEPVQRAIPSAVTPRQETRFSCPPRVITRSPFRVSHALQLKSS